MKLPVLGILFSLTFATGGFATDPYCPAYPASQRTALLQSEAKLRAFRAFSASRARKARAALSYTLAPEDNLIDRHIFGKMQTDGVNPAPQSDDSEFARRVYLDLTGRIPTVEQAMSFLNDSADGKRAALIDRLLASDQYVDKWTLFFGNLFQVTSGYYQFISIQSRNRFHDYLRDFVAADRSWADVARELLTASGNSLNIGPANFIVRSEQQNEPLQDTWDTITDSATVSFLGAKTLCISCHDGRRHLEEINLFLTPKKRADFWRMSAFFSRTNITQVAADTNFRSWGFLLTDLPSGGYTSWVDPNNPGPRPARFGGPYSPSFLMTGETPRSGTYREEFARLLTGNRQFARAAVNYIWAAMFTRGIVDPPGQWDLARIDPANPPPDPWTLQPTHPELIEALASEFINSNYSVKHMVRLMAASRAYQLSSQYPGTWIPAYENYFARHITRRLQAEEVYDAVAQATMTVTPMNLEGYPAPVYYAGQLPDTTEPRNDGSIFNFLSTFGRGDWWNNPRNSSSTIIQALFIMNDNSVNFRDFTNRGTRTAWLLAQGIGDTDAINNLYLAALSRYPTADEMNVLKQARTGTRDQWLSDIQWALLNKLDFLFNH
ncbi:MAG TPA: DUF1553 domain-containing protein [Candidatus Acidoferrum sp.]|nr:DUF1553 domain-containing protein [Candidatus Acidoferrum sp.]